MAMHRDAKHILSHTAIYLIARGLPGIIAFLAIPLFSHLLNPVEYGRYALVIATVMLLNALLFQWLRLATTRYLPGSKDPAALKNTLMTSNNALIAMLGVIALAACLLPIHHEWKMLILPCWAMLSVQTVYELCGEYLRTMMRPWQFMIQQVCRSIGFVGLGAVGIFFGAGWWSLPIGLTVGMAVAVALAYRRDWRGTRWTIDRETFRQTCYYGIPLSATVALAVVIFSSDRFLIAWFMGEGAAGQYSVAVDFTAQTLTLLLMVVSLAVFPMAVRAWEQEGPDGAREKMRSNAALLMAVGVPSVIGLSLLAPGISHCFLGKDFRSAAAGIIPLIALGSFLAGLKAYHFDSAFQFVHRTIYQVWIVLVAAVVNIVLNLIAIPRWGINGAAVASVLAYLVSIALTVIVGRRHFKVPLPLWTAAQVLTAGAVMAVVLYPLRSHVGRTAVCGSIVLGACVYAAVLIGCNFMGLRDALRRRMGKPMRQSTPAAAVVATLIEAQ